MHANWGPRPPPRAPEPHSYPQADPRHHPPPHPDLQHGGEAASVIKAVVGAGDWDGVITQSSDPGPIIPTGAAAYRVCLQGQHPPLQ